MYDNEGNPLYHLYFVKKKGAAILRIARYFSERKGEHPASWPVRESAKWWGRHLSRTGGPNAGEKFKVFKCDHEDCPVCKSYREYNPIKEEVAA